MPVHRLGVVNGSVRDGSGSAIPGARVTISDQTRESVKVCESDAAGLFSFDNLSPGRYQVQVEASGWAPFNSETVSIDPGEELHLPPVTLQLTKNVTTIDVKATLAEVAQEQVKQEEHQRVLGILPNFYTSYTWDAAPMTPGLKFNLAAHSVTDPFTFLVAGTVAGLEQAHGTFKGYHQGWAGYGRRYGATYVDSLTGRLLGSAVFPSLLHQDPRYFYKGSGSKKSRLAYALASAIICRGDDGHLQPNYSHILGSFAVAGMSNIYRSPRDRQAGLTIRNGLIITAGSAMVNVMREFVSRQLTSNVPQTFTSKP